MTPDKQRQAFRLDVNAEITIRIEDLDAQLRVLLADISEGGCRFRVGVKLPAQARISFPWMGPSREPIHVQGRIVAARMANSKTAEYGVKFEMPVAARDMLAHELIEVQRRKAYKPAEVAAPSISDGDTGGRAKRKAYRAAVQFPVTVKAFKDARWILLSGEAGDLSEGGLLLAVSVELDEGTELEIAFTLPLGAVDRGGEEREVVEKTPFGERRVKKLIPVRPFDRIQAKARVMKKAGVGRNGSPQVGIAFVELSAFIKEEIARFVHAHQLTQLRKAAAAQG